MNPTNTVFDAKRLIGRKFTDDVVQADKKHWPFGIVDEGGRPKIEVSLFPYPDVLLYLEFFCYVLNE